MQHLDLYDVLAVAARVMECDGAEAVRRTDVDLVGQVLEESRAEAAWGCTAVAAALLTGFVRLSPFDGPGRRIAVAVVLQFAGLNHVDLRLEPIAEVDALLDRIRTGRAGVPETTTFLRDRWIGPGVANWEETVMFEKFSEPARQVIVLAQEEARMLNHNYIGTEHLLLGLLHQETSGATRVLLNQGVSAQAVRAFVEELIGRGQSEISGHIPFTPRAKEALELSHQASRSSGRDIIGTHHLLIGLIDEGEGVAAQALVKLGIDLAQLRRQLIELAARRKRAEAVVEDFVAEDTEEAGSRTWTDADRRRHLLHELRALIDENERLEQEVARLRDKLRHHDLDPDD